MKNTSQVSNATYLQQVDLGMSSDKTLNIILYLPIYTYISFNRLFKLVCYVTIPWLLVLFQSLRNKNK